MTHTILALDASSTTIGWCHWDGSRALQHGTIKLKGDLVQRICLAETAIAALLRRHAPDAVAVEAPAFSRTDAIVAQQRVMGAILLAVGRYGVLHVEISNSSAKKTLTGKGRLPSGAEGKRAMIEAAEPWLSPEQPIIVMERAKTMLAIWEHALLYDEHAADALGVAMAAWPMVKVGEMAA